LDFNPVGSGDTQIKHNKPKSFGNHITMVSCDLVREVIIMPGRILSLTVFIFIACLLGYKIFIAGREPLNSYQYLSNSLDAGLLYQDEHAFKGYTVLTAINSTSTYLIDNHGFIVNEWVTDEPGFSAALLPNGNLIRTSILNDRMDTPFHSGGETGKIQVYSWDGDLIWDYEHSSSDYLLHHDVEYLPNGNFLLTAWERKTVEEAIQAGRDPIIQGNNEVWVDYLIEVMPTGKNTGDIVWEWHVWDHLIQDHDPKKPNFGVVSEHPERININYFKTKNPTTSQEIQALQSLGYMGESVSTNTKYANQDWTHINAVSYDPERGLIAISVREFNEIWVIEHKSARVGMENSAGDEIDAGAIIFRWGNPAAYNNGTVNDQKLFSQHDVQWIAAGLKGAGNLLLFNNGKGRLDGEYSSILEIGFPLREKDFNADHVEFHQPVWNFSAPEPADFYSPFLSGTQRLPNGNTLICDGMYGMVFEVTEDGEMVWQYKMPIEDTGISASSSSWYRVGIFTTAKYGREYPGLAGKVLKPGLTIEDKINFQDS
jgi:hypothetical protein